MIDLVFNVIGTIGVVMILVAYGLVQMEYAKPTQLAIPVTNLIGSIMLLISLYWTPNIPSVIIEVCWFLISAYSTYKALSKKSAG